MISLRCVFVVFFVVVFGDFVVAGSLIKINKMKYTFIHYLLDNSLKLSYKDLLDQKFVFKPAIGAMFEIQILIIIAQLMKH